jgi:hypothetical protein
MLMIVPKFLKEDLKKVKFIVYDNIELYIFLMWIFNTQISSKNELLTHTQNNQASPHNNVFPHTQILILDTTPLRITHRPPFVLHHFHHQPISNKITHTLHFQCNRNLESITMHEEHSFFYAFQITTILSSSINKTKF